MAIIPTKEFLHEMIDKLPESALPQIQYFLEAVICRETSNIDDQIPEEEDDEAVQRTIEALSDPFRIPYEEIRKKYNLA